MNYHAVPALAQGIVGMALEVATTPASAMDSTNCRAGETQQQADGGELEMRVSRTGYLASMIRHDDDTLEDTPEIEPEKVEIKIKRCWERPLVLTGGTSTQALAAGWRI